MVSIRLLSEEIASQIAAGEVVERPASVVKELVENALDAGARSITIEIEEAGRKLIRVADDGQGIPSDELRLAVARHATSKLAAAEDLFRVSTLGFRGEALASIASVSALTLVSQARGEFVGARLRVEGGAMAQGPHPIGAPQGTVATVENLFFNVPARLKFLKTERAERRQIDALVSRYALAYPEVRFRLTHDGREALQSTGSGDRREALIALYGPEAARQMLGLEDRQSLDVSVSGFVSPPALTRNHRREITLFVNGRWVQDQRLIAAVLQAYHTLLMVGQYPLAVILVNLPPEAVDVNVHPAKAEVRFRDPDSVFSAVQKAVRATLLEKAPVQAAIPQPAWGHAGWAENRDRLIDPAWNMGFRPTPRPAEEPGPALPGTGVLEFPLLRVVGQIGAAYVVAEGPDGLYLIDQHAAHERVLYEQFQADRRAEALTSQRLLEPAYVELHPEQASQLESQVDTLAALGFEVEAFGGGAFRVRAIPAMLKDLDPAQALRVLVEDFEEDERPLEAEGEARLIARVCKRAAVKAGQALSLEEQRELVRRLEACQSPRTCPHGRPTMIHLTIDMLARQFSRKG